MIASRKKPIFFFSFRSPYSWIAEQMLKERLTLNEISSIEYIPYWEPDAEVLNLLNGYGAEFLYQPMTREKHLYILQDVKRITGSLNLKHVWPIDQNPSWEMPVRAYLAASELGKATQFRELLYEIRWERGGNIHDWNVLAEAIAECDLDVSEIDHLRGSSEISDKAAQILVQAWKVGVFGVPFFKFGFDKFWGIDRLTGFISMMRSNEYDFTEDEFGLANNDSNSQDDAYPEREISTGVYLDSDAAGGCG